MKASTLVFSLASILVLSACGDEASLGKADAPIDTSKTGSGGSAGTSNGGTGGSSSSAGGSNGGSGGSSSTGAGGSANPGTGGSTSGGTGGAPAGDGGSDPCALVSCAAGTHCVLEQVVCIQAPCPPMPTCVKDPAPGTECTVATDCRLFDNYCDGCACNALPVNASDPKCSGTMVQCFAAPCLRKTAACSNGKCVVQ